MRGVVRLQDLTRNPGVQDSEIPRNRSLSLVHNAMEHLWGGKLEYHFSGPQTGPHQTKDSQGSLACRIQRVTVNEGGGGGGGGGAQAALAVASGIDTRKASSSYFQPRASGQAAAAQSTRTGAWVQGGDSESIPPLVMFALPSVLCLPDVPSAKLQSDQQRAANCSWQELQPAAVPFNFVQRSDTAGVLAFRVPRRCKGTAMLQNARLKQCCGTRPIQVSLRHLAWPSLAHALVPVCMSPSSMMA